MSFQLQLFIWYQTIQHCSTMCHGADWTSPPQSVMSISFMQIGPGTTALNVSWMCTEFLMQWALCWGSPRWAWWSPGLLKWKIMTQVTNTLFFFSSLKVWLQLSTVCLLSSLSQGRGFESLIGFQCNNCVPWQNATVPGIHGIDKNNAFPGGIKTLFCRISHYLSM